MHNLDGQMVKAITAGCTVETSLFEAYSGQKQFELRGSKGFPLRKILYSLVKWKLTKPLPLQNKNG